MRMKSPLLSSKAFLRALILQTFIQLPEVHGDIGDSDPQNFWWSMPGKSSRGFNENVELRESLRRQRRGAGKTFNARLWYLAEKFQCDVKLCVTVPTGADVGKSFPQSIDVLGRARADLSGHFDRAESTPGGRRLDER